MTPDQILIPPELAGRLEQVGRRPWITQQITAWLAGHGRYFLLTGGPGTGKTTIATSVITDSLSENPEGIWAASYYCSNRIAGYSYHPRQLISRIQKQLLVRYPKAYLQDDAAARPLMQLDASISAHDISGTATGINIAIGQLNASPLPVGDYFQTAIIEPLEKLAAIEPEVRVGILIDGLDESVAYGAPSIATLVRQFAASFPGNCKLLITGQNDPAIVDSLRSTLPDLIHVDLSDARYRSLVDDDIRRHAADALARAPESESLAATTLAATITQAVRGNFLHAQRLIQEFLSGTRPSIDLTTQVDLPGYYLDLFSRLQDTVDSSVPSEQRWEKDCLPLLHCLAAAQSPVPYRELADLTGYDELRLTTALRAVRTLLQVNDAWDDISLVDQSIADFLFSPVLSGHRPNSHAVDEQVAQEQVIDRIADRFTAEWDRSWLPASSYVVSHLPLHLARVQSLAPARAVQYGRQLLLAQLAHRIASDPSASDSPAADMASLLTVMRGNNVLPDFEEAIKEAGRSRNPYVRSSVVDVIHQCDLEDPRLARRVVYSLLRQDDPNSWTTGLSVLTRLGAATRDEIVRWIATEAPDTMRIYAGNSLYVLAGGDAKLLAAQMLRAVAESVSLVHIRKTRRAVEFLSNVSITTYTNNCDDIDVAAATSDLWREVAVKRLHVNIVNHQVLERPILSIAARHLAGRIVDNPFIKDQLSATQREGELVGTLMPGLNPGTSLGNLVEPLSDGFGSDALIARIMCMSVIAVQAISEPAACEVDLDRLFEVSTGEARLWEIMAYSVLLRATPETWMTRIERMVARVLEENVDSVDSYLADDMAMKFLFVSLPLACAKHGVPVDTCLSTLMEGASRQVQVAILEGLTVVGLYYPAAALAGLVRLAKLLPEEDVRAHLPMMMSRMRFVHPTVVDVFVKESGLEVDLKYLDSADMEFVRRHIDTLGLYNNAINQALHYPIMREAIMKPAFAGLARSGTSSDFVKFYAPKVLRLLRDTKYELTRWME